MREIDSGADSHVGSQRAWSRWARGAVTGAVIATTLLSSLPSSLQAAVDQRELRAREAFAVGRYQEALDLFGKLYAEKLHPNYLRNIGRCYQNLGEPDKAINSFRDYLRKARGLPPDERAEVEGFIKEMEELKGRQRASGGQPPAGAAAAQAGDSVGAAGASSSSVAKPATPAEAGTASNGEPQPQAVATSSAPGADLTQGDAPSTADDEGNPIYKRWWFWAVIGGVVATGVGIAAATGAFTKTEEPPCPAGVPCPQ